MDMNERWDEILTAVKKSYQDAIKEASTEGISQLCATLMRTTIEGLVRLFYLKFYRKTYENEKFNLSKAIRDPKFTRHIPRNSTKWQEIDDIRFAGNNQVHFVFDQDTVQNNIKKFNSAVQTLQNKLGINIMPDVSEGDKPDKSVLETQSKSLIKKSSEPNIKGTVQRGEEFHVQTNAALLNLLLGTNYKAWMKCWINLTKDRNYQLVMLSEGEIINGWTNTFEEPAGIFREDFVGTRDEKLSSHEGLPPTHRAIFMKCGKGKDRNFVFCGIYELLGESTPNHRISKRIADEEDFSKYRFTNRPYHKD